MTNPSRQPVPSDKAGPRTRRDDLCRRNRLRGEPTLAEMLGDPTLRNLMARDRVQREEIEDIARRHGG